MHGEPFIDNVVEEDGINISNYPVNNMTLEEVSKLVDIIKAILLNECNGKISLNDGVINNKSIIIEVDNKEETNLLFIKK